ncbi:MAG TPA: OFA family MFS transporter [Verrucomicrobiales bacterium]|nr:OFA family MFS transporter [Verrucomicrobiales bacterium]
MPSSISQFLSREATVAKPGYSRWLVPPAAIAVHMCIGQVYAFSVFNKPLAAELGALVSSVQWAYSIALIMLGLSAAVFGKWVERSGPRKTMTASWACFCGGLLLAALGVQFKSLTLILFGYGFVGGIGLGLGYISPVSTLVKWFPDRPGMATGMAIMGFGGGALIGSPLAQELMKHFANGTDTGARSALFTMAAIYTVFMLFGAALVRVPAADWKPEGWVPKTNGSRMITTASVAVDTAWKTPQFWFLWVVLCMNVSAGIGVLGRASDMFQDMFYGTAGSEAQKAANAAIGAGFAGLLSIFNMGGRFVWSSVSDKTGRKQVYCIYFILGAVLYALLPWAQQTQSKVLFVCLTAVIISMYGGGFATIPAYLKDMFGTYQVGAIHGRLITSWSMAAVIGPLLINGLYDQRVAAGIPKAEAYNNTFYLMCGLLAVGLIANLLVRPVHEQHHEKSAA